MSDSGRAVRGPSRPPYAPVKGVRDFFDRVRGKVAPARVDRAYLASLGVAAGNEQHVVITLKFLGLIDETGQPGRHFAVLYLKGPERQRGLQNVVRQAYPGLFGGDLDLQRASRAELHDHFVKRYGVQGQMARKTTALFVLLCTLAGIPVSPDLAPARSAAREGRPARASGGERSGPVAARLPDEGGAVRHAGIETFPVVVALTADLSEEEMVAVLRRAKRAAAIVAKDDAYG